jgi:malonyl-CoA reductase/3-hydroxypropionate dehydrogenase (NADP+)
MAGARVLLSAAVPSKLEAARDSIVEELRGIGYPDPEERVSSSPTSTSATRALQRLYREACDRALRRVDYLINNAGISGAEEMVVDMTLEDWNRTMEANLSPTTR